MRNFGISCCYVEFSHINAATLHNSMGAGVSVIDTVLPSPQPFAQSTRQVTSRVHATQRLCQPYTHQWGAVGCATFLSASLVKRTFLELSEKWNCALQGLRTPKIAS